MSITVVNSWTVANSASINTSTGAQTQISDLLLFAISSGTATPNITGFTTLISITGSGPNFAIQYKIAAAGDIGATFSINNALNAAGGIVSLRGVDLGRPIDAFGAGSQGSSTSPAAASITLTGSVGDTLLWIDGSDTVTAPLTLPVGYGTVFNVPGVGGTNYTCGMGYKSGVLAGTTGTVTGTIATGTWNAVLIGIQSLLNITVGTNYVEDWSIDY